MQFNLRRVPLFKDKDGNIVLDDTSSLFALPVYRTFDSLPEVATWARANQFEVVRDDNVLGFYLRRADEQGDYLDILIPDIDVTSADAAINDFPWLNGMITAMKAWQEEMGDEE